MDEVVLDSRALAQYLGCSVAAVRAWKRQGRGPAYCKLGKLVRYRRAEVDAWIAGQRVNPGSNHQPL